MEPILRTNKKGRTFLRVFYFGGITDAYRAIERAISERGLDRDRVTAIAYPIGMKREQLASVKARQRIYHG